MIKFRKGDSVKITAGKDKGREGKIEKVDPESMTALIPDINLYKRHVKGSAVQKGQKGGIYELPRPVVFAKLALICPKCKKVTRIGFRMAGKDKVRVCRKCGKEIDQK